jgi:hypothetical protein
VTELCAEETGVYCFQFKIEERSSYWAAASPLALAFLMGLDLFRRYNVSVINCLL